MITKTCACKSNNECTENGMQPVSKQEVVQWYIEQGDLESFVLYKKTSHRNPAMLYIRCEQHTDVPCGYTRMTPAQVRAWLGSKTSGEAGRLL